MNAEQGLALVSLHQALQKLVCITRLSCILVIVEDEEEGGRLDRADGEIVMFYTVFPI